MKTEFSLFGEDCIAGMRRLEACSVDLIVTSPPYNLGINYGQYDDRKTKEQYLAGF
jgi:site-specific DNA-methyltransferase (adenine-specific)